MSTNRHNRKNIYGTGNFSFLPQITDRTNEQFLEEILKIHKNQYTPINQIPTIFGRKINLLVLYNAVARQGGFKKMNTELSWEGVLADLKMPIKCANASVALRNIFQRYLEPFERIQRNKATIDEIEENLQMESENRYKTSAQRTTLSHCNFNPTSMAYRADIHLVDSHKRQEYGLSCDLADVVEFQKLEMSLKSGLSNEIEFSLNTILLMSFQIDGVQLCRNHRLLDLILSTIGIGNSEMMKDLSQHDRSIRAFIQFWNENVTLKEGRRFLLPDIFVTEDFNVSRLNRLNNMFKLCDELTIYDKEGQRIQLVATIIRNVALDSSNSRCITQSHQCMRLIVLCCYSTHFALRQLGLEILSMLSFPVVGILAEIVKHVLVNLIEGEDRVDRLRGLEFLAHLSDQKVCIDNSDFLMGLPKHLFQSLISMLILHDLHIVVLALEAVYGLSEIDPYLCIKLIECSAETLSTLYILLSLEAQVMGSQSLIRIRVMQGPAMANNQISANRPCLQQPQSSCKQLATSLMPPPPVPSQKSSATTVPIPHCSSLRPQIYGTTEAPNKPQLTQIIYPEITTIDAIIPSHGTPNVAQTTVQPNLGSELITTSFIPRNTLETVSRNTTSLHSLSNTQTSNNLVPTTAHLTDSKSQLNSSVIPTNVTISQIITPVSANNISSNKPINISTAVNDKCAQESLQTINKTALSSPSVHMISENCHTDVISTNIPDTIHPISVPQIFTNKQDFVKNWLLNNYQESSQCTVPLLVMYKTLQVAVQNYFRDSEIVTAEEFHKLVRILFPRVQLVKLQTSGDDIEIHYYNLKLSPKRSTAEVPFEYQVSKCKDTSNFINDVPPVNCAQLNGAIVSIATDNNHCDQKLSKRHATEMVNGYFTEDYNSDQCPNKRPRTANGSNYSTYMNNNDHPSNGMVIPCHTINDNQKNPLIPLPERNCQSYAKVQPNLSLNGSVHEELKHSDLETKAFSSSTVSPIHCESLVNGTDGSSEGTMDSEFGKIIANMPSTEAQIVPQIQSVAFNCPATILQETNINTVPASKTNVADINVNKRSIKKNNLNQLGRTRSRFRNTNPGSKGKQRNSSSQKPHNLSFMYICEWDNCLQSFDKPQKVYGHVYTNHFMTLRTEVESMCFWAGCNDIIQRTPLPLLNHVNEQHCNNIALEAARQIRLAKEKENEKTTLRTVNNNTLAASEIIPKLLNFCPPQSTDKAVPVTDSTTSYQTDTISTLSQPSMIPVTLLSTCASVQPTTSSSTVSNAPLPFLSSSPSIVEQLIVSSQSLSESPQLMPSSITTVSTNQQNHIPPRLTSETNESSTSCATINNTQSTVIPSLTSNQSSTIAIPPLPMVKHTKTEGPVTKHIRFLSALILRNLCKCSSDARRFVAARNQQIFELSISGCESSRALSECLFYSSIDIGGNTQQKK